MSLAKLHRTMPTTIWIYPTCCHTFGKSPTNVKDFQEIPLQLRKFQLPRRAIPAWGFFLLLQYVADRMLTEYLYK